MAKGLNLHASMKSSFFDRAKVMSAIDKGTRKALAYFGAAVRKQGRREIGSPSIRKPGRKPTPPRTPPGAPRARTSHPYASFRNIEFFYDDSHKSVIIGVVRVGSKTVGGKPLPGLHHWGGSARVRIKQIPLGKRKGVKQHRKPVMIWVNSPKAPPRTVNYKKRPWMVDAFIQKQRELKTVMKDMMHKW